MKKHLILLVCILFAGTIFAQQHLSFKGVPINGTLQEYTNAMVKAGFHYEGTQDGVSILSGDFAGYKGCTVGVSTLKNLDVVSRIAVLFPNKDTWSAVLGDYEHLKAMLTEKYGTPSDSQERFKNYTGNYDNSLVMYALEDDEYVWYTTFTTELGDIELTIMAGTEYGTACVRLSYYDKANSEKVHSAAMDDL
ncbi:MAG: hypothetical protein IKQ75_00240 [Bacteroidales bacterium]|nr:hypothetical protein [Bacteroidales bacterium]MBR6160278.1 hypothetical protein [Bacteroidales bacterium]